MRSVLKVAVPVALLAVGMLSSASEAQAGWGVSVGMPSYGGYYGGAPYSGYYGAPYNGGYYYGAPQVVAAPVAPTPYYVAPAPVYRTYVAPPPVPFGIGLNFYGGGGYPGYGGYHHHHHRGW